MHPTSKEGGPRLIHKVDACVIFNLAFKMPSKTAEIKARPSYMGHLAEIQSFGPCGKCFTFPPFGPPWSLQPGTSPAYKEA